MNKKKFVKNIWIIMGISILLSLIYTIFTSFATLDTVTHAVVQDQTLYLVDHNDDQYILYCTDLEGKQAEMLTTLNSVVDTEEYSIESLTVDDSVVTVTFAVSSLEQQPVENDLLVVTVELDSKTVTQTKTQSEHMDASAYLVQTVDDVVYTVDCAGTIWADDTLLFDNNGSEISVDNLGYQWYEDNLWFYNISDDSIYTVDRQGDLQCRYQTVDAAALGYVNGLSVQDEIVLTYYDQEDHSLPLLLSGDTTVKRVCYATSGVVGEGVGHAFLLFLVLFFLLVFYKIFPTIIVVAGCLTVVLVGVSTEIDLQLADMQLDNIINTELGSFTINAKLSGSDFVDGVTYYEVEDDGIVSASDHALQYITVEHTCSSSTVDALNAVSELSTITYTTVNDGLFSNTGVSIFVCIYQDGMVRFIAEETYWSDSVSTSTYLLTLNKMEWNVATIAALFILTFTILLSGQVFYVNYKIRKTGQYSFKRKGIGELMRLQYTLSEMSRKNQKDLQKILKVKEAYASYMPPQMLELFGKQDVSELQVGDTAKVRQTVLVLRSYNFLEMENNKQNDETFAFVDRIFKTVSQQAEQNGGFVSEFYRVNAMSLFPMEMEENTLLCGGELLQTVRDNTEGVGFGACIMQASLTIGVVGNRQHREFLSVSPDLENALELSRLSYQYQSGVLMLATMLQVLDPHTVQNHLRFIGCMDWSKPKISPRIYEDIRCLDAEQISLRMQTKALFEQAVHCMLKDDYGTAKDYLIQVLKKNAHDRIAYHYFSICNDIQDHQDTQR